MAETISMQVHGRVPGHLLRELFSEITPQFARQLLRSYNPLYSPSFHARYRQKGYSKWYFAPVDRGTTYRVSGSYRAFPTEDLALRAFETPNGLYFWGIASGADDREEKAAVKYLAIRHIQDRLAERGVRSEINIAGLNQDTIDFMKIRGMFKGRLTELRRIAKKRGNLQDTMIGASAATNTPA